MGFGEERLPNLVTAADGTMVLVYMGRAPEKGRWQLRLAQVEIDPRTGAPLVRSTTVRPLAETDDAVLPMFSEDGRWVYAILFPERSRARAEQFSVLEVLGREGYQDQASLIGDGRWGREGGVGKS